MRQFRDWVDKKDVECCGSLPEPWPGGSKAFPKDRHKDGKCRIFLPAVGWSTDALKEAAKTNGMIPDRTFFFWCRRHVGCAGVGVPVLKTTASQRRSF